MHPFNPLLQHSITPLLQSHSDHFEARFVAEGARFELAVHEVDAGFQDRWFQPLTHPSDTMDLVGRFGLAAFRACE